MLSGPRVTEPPLTRATEPPPTAAERSIAKDDCTGTSIRAPPRWYTTCPSRMMEALVVGGWAA